MNLYEIMYSYEAKNDKKAQTTSLNNLFKQ
jgi:hypothetical protein